MLAPCSNSKFKMQTAKLQFKIQSFFLLSLILAIAVFFRFWQLESIPPGLYPDVAINGNEAISNPGQLFYPENNGREGLFINLIALSFGLFGISVWSIKAVAAFFGTLTVLGTYLLTRELFNREFFNNETMRQLRNEGIALLASFFFAASFWHINFSRVGFRAILLPFILVFSFYFLFRGIRTKKILDFILAGIAFGLGFYTYTSFRMAVFLLPIPLAYLWFLLGKRLNKQFLFSIFYFLFSVFVVALPIGLYFLQHPADFASRAAPISVFAQENPLLAFGESFVRHLAMFNIYGDPNWRHNYAGTPQLLWSVGILFLVGIGISIKKAFESIKTKNCLLFTVNCFLLSWLFVMVLPGALTYEGIPHALRTIGVLPVPYIFAAMGAVALYDLCNRRIQNKKTVIIVIAILFLSTVAFSAYYDYFIKWAENPHVQGAFTVSYVKIGEYLNSLPPETKKYVIVNEPGVPVPLPDGIPMPAQTPMFIERTKYYTPLATYLKPEEINQINSRWKPVVIIPMKYDENLANQIKIQFPAGEEKLKNGIWIYQL